MLKLFFTLLTDPLGLPIGPWWEYVILILVGLVARKIAFWISPGGRLGSLIHWGTRAIIFIALWAVLYAVIATIQFIIAHWVWFAIGGGLIIAAGIVIVIKIRRKRAAERE